MILDPDARHFTRLMKPDFGLGLGLGQPSGGHIVPALDLSFINGETLDSRITFSRASAATRVNSSGLIETVASGTARFDYDPVTLAAKGLLIEEQRTNLLVRSAEFDHASWSKGGVLATANASTSPDGGTNADLLENTNGVGSCTIAQSITASGIIYTATIYFKGGTTDSIVLTLRDITAGANLAVTCSILSGPGTVGGSATIPAVSALSPTEWTRVQLTLSSAATSGNMLRLTIYPETSGTATGKNLYAWGAQLEAGSFATSYIPTAGSRATRAGDEPSISGTAFSSFFNPTEGTFIVSGDAPADSVSSRSLVHIDDGTTNNRIRFYGSLISAKMLVAVSAAMQADITAGTVSAGTTFKLGGVYKANGFAASLNGAAAVTDTSGTLPAPSVMRIGWTAGSGQYLCGHIGTIRYYRSRLIGVTLGSMTA